MRVHHLEITNFRSIANASLPTIGDLNVLIGQNNSGKSNLLSCLNIFFRCIASEDVVIGEVAFGSNLDFHNRNVHAPIDIRAIFSLSAAERDGFLGDVISEVPEMRNAVEGLDHSLLLSVRVQARRDASDEPLVYIPEIAFVRPGNLTSPERGGRTILEVGPEAAGELHSRRQASNRMRATASALQSFRERFDEDDWTRFGGRGSEREPGTPPLSYYLREFVGSPEILSEARKLLSESRSYEDFQASSLSQINALQSEAEATQTAALSHKISTLTGEVTSVPQYINKLLHRVAEVGVLHLRERRKEIGAEEAERLLNLKVSRGGPDVLRGIQEIVQSLLGVQVDAFSVGPIDLEGDRFGRRRPRQRAELDVDNFLVEANGAGIREALRIILDYEFEHPNLVLIEEPEIHLHPALETSMLRYLKTLSKSCQIFIATHSTNFLDTADLGNVYLTSKTGGETTVKLLSTEQILEEVPRELGLRLSSLFMFDRLVFVEGATDESILREMAGQLGKNFAGVNAGFVVMGGARATPYFASEATISFLHRRQVKCWFVMDRDEREDDEIRRINGRLGDNVELTVLSKREMENYLMIPRVLSEYIEARLNAENRAHQVRSPSVEDVERDIQDCVEESKQIAIFKRLVSRLCKPSFSRLTSRREPDAANDVAAIVEDIEGRIDALKSVREKVAEAAKQVEQEISARWEKERFDIIPGEELLRRVFGRYGLAYKKERDGIGLAGSLKKDEVHADVKRIIEDVCKN